MDAMENLPRPTTHAKDILNVTLSIVNLIFPQTSVLKEFFDIMINKRIKRGQYILIEEISKNGIDSLTKEQFDFYIPSAYRFFEQVRIGEYEHNLRILAKLISGELGVQGEEPDTGRVGRASKKTRDVADRVFESAS